MMKDPEPQSAQATHLPSITRRRHPALSPETRTLAYYRYCSWAGDSTTTVLVVPPAFLPPEPEVPPGTGDAEAEGAAPEGSSACGADAQVPDATGSDAWASGVADAEAGVDAEGDADAEADAEGGADEEAGTYAPPASSTDGMP